MNNSATYSIRILRWLQVPWSRQLYINFCISGHVDICDYILVTYGVYAKASDSMLDSLTLYFDCKEDATAFILKLS